jgi:DNA replication initiation complex subunit (GINS family)
MWIADELVKSGMAKVAAEKGPLNLTELQKIQIRETMQPSRKLSTLPEHFYPKLRRFLKELKEKSSTDPSKAVEFQKALQLGTDIVTCRLNKVTLLASASDQTENILQFLSPEERVLYERLHKEIAEWKLNVMKHGGAIK